MSRRTRSTTKRSSWFSISSCTSWFLLAALLAGCAAQQEAASGEHEGTLTLYTTIAEKDLPTLIDPFEAEHGIKVNIWRAGTDRVLQRTMSESSAGRNDVDVVHFGSPEMEALARENVLAPVD
jgi:iron(III) transport system substrate-binding protein